MTLNVEQYLLTTLAEEASEVAQEASKCIRFTCTHTNPVTKTINIDKLEIELRDLMTIVHMLEKHLGIMFNKEPSMKKEDTVLHYMNISTKLGVLE